MKRHAPKAQRNRDAIAEVLARELPGSGLVLEVASGTGEHAVHFARRFGALNWQPSDADPAAVASIDAHASDAGLQNLRPAAIFDVVAGTPPVAEAAAIVCINMVHISPWTATLVLFEHAAKLLGPGAPLVLYGPYLEAEVDTVVSNLEFDASLKARHPEWGLRELSRVDEAGAVFGFERTARYPMPANNLTLFYRRK